MFGSGGSLNFSSVENFNLNLGSGGNTLAITGGAAALETTQIEEIEDVEFEELLPECLWKFRVKDFGPLTVAMDSHGVSLYESIKARAGAKLEELAAKL